MLAGQYNLKSSIELSKGITMISRRTNLDNLESGKVPGPGAYLFFKKINEQI